MLAGAENWGEAGRRMGLQTGSLSSRCACWLSAPSFRTFIYAHVTHHEEADNINSN